MGNLSGSSTPIFAGALLLALLAGLFVGAGGGLAIIAIGLLGTTIMFARSQQAAAGSETSAVFQSAGTPSSDAQSAVAERPDPGREDDQSRPSV